MSRIAKSAGIITTKSITTSLPKTTIATKEPVKRPAKEPIAKKVPPIEPKVQPTDTEYVPGQKTVKQPRKKAAKKNAPTKAAPFKPTVMFIFPSLNGMGVAQGYLRGADMTYKSGKLDDNRPAVQIEGRGSVNKEMLKLFREHLKNHRIQFEEEKLW